MKNYRRYKNTKIGIICQMEIVKLPEPAPLSEFQKWMIRGMANSAQTHYGGQAQNQAPDLLSSLVGGIGGGVGPTTETL